MWRVATLVQKRGDVPMAEFARQWLGVIAPAIAKAAGNAGSVSRVVVNVPPENLGESLRSVFPPAYDGLIEFWFADPEDAVSTMQIIGDDAALRELALPVIDGARSVSWLAQCFPIKPERGSTVKFLAGGDVAEGVELEDAQAYWRDQHPVVAQTAPQVWEPLTRYTQFHGKPQHIVGTIDWLAQGRFVPLCSDMGFVETDDFLKVYGCEQYARIVRPDEEKFSRPGEMLSFISSEERVLFEAG